MAVLFIILLKGMMLAYLTVEAKRFDQKRLIPMPEAERETVNAVCEFECDRHCSLNAKCVGTSFDRENGTCVRVFNGSIALQGDSHAVAKTRGIVKNLISIKIISKFYLPSFYERNFKFLFR